MPPKGSRKKADNSKENLVVAQSDPNQIKSILEKAKQRAKDALGTSDKPSGDTKQKLISLPSAPAKRPVPPADVTEPTSETVSKPNPGGESSGSKPTTPATRVFGKTSPPAPSSAAAQVGAVEEPPAKKAKGCVPDPNVPPTDPGDAVVPTALPTETPRPGDGGVRASMELDSKPSPTSVGSPTYVTPSPRPHEDHHHSGEKQAPGEARRALDFGGAHGSEHKLKDWDWGQQAWQKWEHGWDAGYKWGQQWEWGDWRGSDDWNDWDNQSVCETASIFSDDMHHETTRQHVLDALQRGPTATDVECEEPTPVQTPHELDETDAHESQPPPPGADPSQVPLPGQETAEMPEPSSPGSVKSDGNDSENGNSSKGDGSKSPEHEPWRCDKHGNPLSPGALYMRFYRGIRSIMASSYSSA